MEEAIVSHDEALKLANNKGRKEWNNKGIALQVLGEILMNIRNIEEAAKKMEEAVEAFDMALKLTGNKYVDAWNNRGISLHLIGKYY